MGNETVMIRLQKGTYSRDFHDCLLNRLFRCRSKKTSKLRVTGLCAGNSPVTGKFPPQRASNAENVSIWWRHHAARCPAMLLIGPLGTNFSEILIGIQTFSFMKMHLKMSSAKWRPFVSASMSWYIYFLSAWLNTTYHEIRPIYWCDPFWTVSFPFSEINVT